MSAWGFQNNGSYDQSRFTMHSHSPRLGLPIGGCECGCGVKCKAPYLRWSCPGDIAYACSDGFDAPPLYGDPDRLAPCVQQDSEGVLWTVRIFMLGLPHLAARRMSARPTGTDPLEWRRIVGLPTLLFIWALAAAWCTTLWRWQGVPYARDGPPSDQVLPHLKRGARGYHRRVRAGGDERGRGRPDHW